MPDFSDLSPGVDVFYKTKLADCLLSALMKWLAGFDSRSDQENTAGLTALTLMAEEVNEAFLK